MTFGRGPLLSQKFNILQKRRHKRPEWLSKYMIRKRERFNMFRKLVFHGTMYLNRGELKS